MSRNGNRQEISRAPAQSDPMIDGHEKTLLAAMMNGARDLPVGSDDFSPVNRKIFEAIKADPNPELFSVQDQLKRLGQLEEVGGHAGLTEVYDRGAGLGPLSIKYALDEVLDASRARRESEIGKALLENSISAEEAIEGLLKFGRSSSGLPSIEDAAQLVQSPPDLPPEIIEGLLHKASKAVVGGGSKSFKTWLLCGMAISVACGSNWLGRQCRQGRVLYINLELQRGFFAARIKTICDRMKVHLPAANLHLWNLRGYAADLGQLMPAILQRVSSATYDLIIFDSDLQGVGRS